MIFNKDDFNSTAVCHLNFENNFEINTDSFNSFIIFGYNGIGKSCISKCFSDKYPGDVCVINYEEQKDSFISSFKRKKYILKPFSKEYEVAKKELEEAEANLNIEGIVSQSLNKNIKSLALSQWQYLARIGNTKNLDILKITNTKIKRYSFLLDAINEIKNNLDYFQIKTDFTHERGDILNSILKDFLEMYLKHISYAKNLHECPLCGNHIHSLEKTLSKKLQDIKDISHSAFVEYLSKHNDKENRLFLNRFSKLMLKISLDPQTEKDFCEFLICEGDPSYRDEINNKIKIIKQKTSKLAKLQTKISDCFQGMLIERTQIDKLFLESFEFKTVNWDIANNQIELTAKRDLKTYSTGELNFMTFVVLLLAAKGSDKKLIVFDDPLSSYDIPNQYKIIFEIVNYISLNSKIKTIIFTHNPETINIATSQRYNLFTYKYIEEYQGKLILLNIPIKNGEPLINLEEIIKNETNGYLDLNRKRNTVKKANKVFHYDEPYSLSRYCKSYSNDYLANLIETYSMSNLSLSDFSNNTAIKALYLLALRVYAERKIYLALSANGNLRALRKLKGKDLFHKINFVLPVDGTTLIPQYTNLSRDKIIRKKSMLNLSDHFYSSQQPFYFAINISLSMLDKEINDIKDLFS